MTTGLGSHLDQRLRAYPFTSFQMFAKLRVRQPYDRHLPYALPAGHFVLDPPSAGASEWLDQAYRTTLRCDPRELHARLEGILHHASRRYAGTSFRGIRLELVMLETGAYPAPARLEPYPVGIVAELLDGAFTSELGTAHRERLLYFRDDRSDAYPQPVPGTRIVVALVDARRWVIQMAPRP